MNIDFFKCKGYVQEKKRKENGNKPAANLFVKQINERKSEIGRQRGISIPPIKKVVEGWPFY